MELLFTILAQSSGSQIPFIDYINLGVIVAVLIAVLRKKWLVPGWAYEEKSLRLEKAEAQIELLRDKIEKELLPAVIATTDVLGRFTDKKTGSKTD